LTRALDINPRFNLVAAAVAEDTLEAVKASRRYDDG